MRQLAAAYLGPKDREVCAVLDGDKRTGSAGEIRTFTSAVEPSGTTEREAAKAWVTDRLSFLPGTAWPEAWVLDQVAATALDDLAKKFGCAAGRLKAAIGNAQRSGKHNEYYTLANDLASSEAVVRTRFPRVAFDAAPSERDSIVEFVEVLLSGKAL